MGNKASKTKTRIILWLRNDLRLHDNHALSWAIKYGKGADSTAPMEILPVFCFDPRIYLKDQSQTKYATRKTGLIRSRFQVESVENLRSTLKSIGSNLILCSSEPESYLPKLVSADAHNVIVYQQEICSEELHVEAGVRKAASDLAAKDQGLSIQIESVWGSTLYHIDDLPFKPKEYLQHIYGRFRKITAPVRIRPVLGTPEVGDLPFPDQMDSTI